MELVEAGAVGSMMRAIASRMRAIPSRMCAIPGHFLSLAAVALLPLVCVSGAFAANDIARPPLASDTKDAAARRGNDVDESRTAVATPRKRPAIARTPLDAGDDRSRRYWYDGKRKRALRVDRDWIADFRSAGEPGANAARGANGSGANGSGAKESATKAGAKDAGTGDSAVTPLARADASKRISRRSPLERVEPGSARMARGPGVSEVLRNEAGSPRALPGGVIVRVHESDRRNAYDVLVDAGLHPVRAIDPEQRSWLVESPAGLESLELANRLHESGRFESASPNWWRPRALK